MEHFFFKWTCIIASRMYIFSDRNLLCWDHSITKIIYFLYIYSNIFFFTKKLSPLSSVVVCVWEHIFIRYTHRKQVLWGSFHQVLQKGMLGQRGERYLLLTLKAQLLKHLQQLLNTQHHMKHSSTQTLYLQIYRNTSLCSETKWNTFQWTSTRQLWVTNTQTRAHNDQVFK